MKGSKATGAKLRPNLIGEIISVVRLRQALALLLDYYPHLTGRLQINETDGTPEISSLGTGALLLEAKCPAPLDEFCSQPDVTGSSASRILVTNLPGRGNALLAPFDPSLEGVCRDPIFTIQHTRFACGGVTLGVRLHHIVCDSDGFFQFVHDLAEIYRHLRAPEFRNNEDTGSGTPLLAHPPCIRSYMAELRDMTPEERQAALAYQPSWLYVEPNNEHQADAPITAPPRAQHPITGRVLRFSGHELAELKAAATDPSGLSWISTFDALTAHLFQQIHLARLQLSTSQNVSPSDAESSPPSRAFLTSVNLRGPTRLNLPPRYFPNAVVCPHGIIDAAVLAAQAPLWEVTKAIHDITHSRDNNVEDIRHTLRWIAAQPDKRRVKAAGFVYGTGSFVVSQWCKFGMYAGAEFEVPPALVAPPFTPISTMDGLAFFLATEELVGMEHGGGEGLPPAIDVNLTLSEPVWKVLDQDTVFRQFGDF
ncbi:uncharacterized protein LTHEOB_4579 [Lasiodiplodia theobromae]|uniref:uncharacterized protein n=1 Tax=Lasiodiplodia theobromae TaxID=45133 RepID=UPI0015C3AC2F|nr:uncharacterized protein LTHEOB_4579 [Lasiodiplodia theobromae]KAF4545927.1 hypothetical protein LTHEOB_4579 [Lasiodiplodia theobromae]